MRKLVYDEIGKIRTDIFNVENDILISDNKYHKWITDNKYMLIPKKVIYSKNSINYDVCENPNDYLKCMVNINAQK